MAMGACICLGSARSGAANRTAHTSWYSTRSTIRQVRRSPLRINGQPRRRMHRSKAGAPLQVKCTPISYHAGLARTTACVLYLRRARPKPGVEGAQ